MMTALIATADPATSRQLRACLEQTGLVSSVREWTVAPDKFPDPAEILPEVVLLDLGRDPDMYFALAKYFRGVQPGIRIIACSATAQPDPQTLLEAMRCGVQEFLAKPVQLAGLQEVLERFVTEAGAPEKRQLEKLIVVMGSKGGVGASTVAVNLGVQIAQRTKKRVLLLDFARPLGNLHLMLDLHPRFGVRDAVENLHRLDTHFFSGLLVSHKSGVDLLPGVLQPEEWERVSIPSLERVVNVAQNAFDWVVMDFGSQFSTEWSPILKLALKILIVAETNVPALWALERRVLALLGGGLEPDRVRVVINRWRRTDEEALKAVEKNIKQPIFACIPNDFRVVSEAINVGTPLMANHNNPLTARFAQLAGQLVGAAPAAHREPRTGGGLANLFSFSPKR
jgi:pilus assembly protein CpaE